MGRQMSIVGGARMSRGRFEVYVSRDKERIPMDPGPLLDYTREYWDFLMSPSDRAFIGTSEVRKAKSSSGLTCVNFRFLGFRVALYKKGDGFATFVLELPFPESAGQVDEPFQYADANEYGDEAGPEGGYTDD